MGENKLYLDNLYGEKNKMEVNFDKLQKDVIENKKEKGFNTSNIEQEFCLLYGEVAEAFDAYNKNFARDELGSELADIAIYLLGISEMLGFSLADEINKKMETNSHRIYKKVNGKLTKFDDRD